MSSMIEAVSHDQTVNGGVATFPPSASGYKVKRVGGRPLHFEGTELAMAMSFTPDVDFWYEINLYRTSGGTFVTAVRLFHQSSDKQDTVRAWENESVDDAMDKLIRYDAAYDVEVPTDAGPNTGAPAALAAKSMELMAAISRARHHYRSLVGELLHDLESGA